MQHYTSLQAVNVRDAWLTIGAFDGVHLGHQQILQELTAGAHASGAPAVVLTFFPHPIVVLRGPQPNFYLTSPNEKAALLAEAGVDIVITHPFDYAVSQIAAREFVQDLKEYLGLAQLWVGHDFALGRNREGDIPTLQQFGAEMGFSMQVVEEVTGNGAVISSSLIRRALQEGDVRQATDWLGRYYNVDGKVVHGDGRGRTIGIPTANIDYWPERVIPAKGVYACRAQVNGQTWASVTNIGVRPTFDVDAVQTYVETHLLDYDGGEIYSQRLKLEFLAHIRDEQRFSGVDELVAQIHRDIETARQYLQT
jgi:riboflavin kinase/FMN adenylyltransferase